MSGQSNSGNVHSEEDFVCYRVRRTRTGLKIVESDSNYDCAMMHDYPVNSKRTLTAVRKTKDVEGMGAMQLERWIQPQLGG